MIAKILVQCLLITCVYAISKHPILIVVSYDAFRYTSFDTELVPNMKRLKNVGTYADHLINVFPTKTFPNHHSIATGLYPKCTVSSVTAITILTMERRSRRRSIFRDYDVARASFPYQGQNITYIKTFQPDYDWSERVKTVISWITDDEKPANLVMLYFEEPDTHGHAFGPDSEIVNELIEKLDNITLYLEEQLEQHNLSDKVNVIHLSDHGMVSVTPPYFINITQYLKNGTYEWTGASPCIQIIPHDGYEDEIYKSLKAGSEKQGHFTVFKKS
ncbi:hypothetical protein NQ318_004367 [Aromia moschata]|uniref:Uncharacterized protein n=1 Tax=Aromia moschata TaxID=1265417 RepID=A0AAV8YQ53_9CUCU|nr:hypothetical protein NQ318_004367 [Aromia moschata]